MFKTFKLEIPLPLPDSFELLSKSGHDVRGWRTRKADKEEGYIEWKQSFLSFSGTATIIARLEQKKEKKTSVEIAVHKPFQMFDPLGICDKVFYKLDRTWKKNLKSFKRRAR